MIPAAYRLRCVDLDRAKMPMLLIMAVAILWMILQLIPLPPSVWRTLPGRGLLFQIDQLTGHSGTWRPLSLAPLRGLDSVFAMIVPLCAFLLALSVKPSRRVLLLVLAVLGLCNSAIGLVQFLGGSSSLFYLFSGASPGAVEGIFGNENHSAVFSAVSLLLIARLMLESQSDRDPSWHKLLLAPAYAVILLAILISGSRAGLIAAVIALLASGLMWSLSSRRRTRAIKGPEKERSFGRGGRAAIIICVAAIVMVIFAFIWLERAPAFDDITQRNAFEDLRWALWPVLREMAADHWLFGTGFGSFEAVYRLYEPTDLLMPAYVNHAHNDWAQLIIEGGLPALIVLVALLWWIVRALVDLAKRGREQGEKLAFWLALVMIVAAASLVDYPLRTPTYQATVVWLLLCLAIDRSCARSGSSSRNQRGEKGLARGHDPLRGAL